MSKKSKVAEQFHLSEGSVAILKNFAKYNEGIVIQPGNVLKTMTAQRNVFAEAEIKEEFPREVALYNLNEFLNCLGLFEKPGIEFGEKSMMIRDEHSSMEYVYADKSVVVHPTQPVKFPGADLEFDVTNEDLQRVLSAARLLALPTISISARNGKLILRAHDASNQSSNKFELGLGVEVEADADYDLNFRLENLKMLELPYHVEVCFRGISHFVNKESGIQYYIGLAPSNV